MTGMASSVALWARVMLAVTWQLAALVVLALLCERMLRLRHPRVRYALWWFVLAAPLLLAPARLWLAQGPAQVQVTVPAAAVAAFAPATRMPAVETPWGSNRGSASRSSPVSAVRRNLPAPLAILWLAGCLLFMLRLTVGHWKARQLLRDGERVGDSSVLETLLELCRQAEINRKVELRTSAAVDSAMLYGVLRPVIVLPQEWLVKLDREHLRAMLAHEVAHVCRRDLLSHFAQRVIEAMLFFHPGQWLAGHRIALSREEMCDDWALRHGLTRSGYARTLAVAAEHARARLAMATVGLAESRFTLLRRVEAIMRGEGQSRTGRLALIALAAAVLVVTATFAAVQLRAESAGGGGGGIHSGDIGGGGGIRGGDVGGGGGGGGWHDSGSAPSGGADPLQTASGGGDVRTPYRTSTGYALAPGFTPLALLTIADLDPKQLRHYAVGKRVTDYPDREDLSLPELSYATFMRAAARGDEGIWRRLSTPRVASDPRLPPVDAPLEEVSPTDVKLYLGRKIVEVYVYQGRRAEVVGAVFHEDGTFDAYELRSLELLNGQWLNRGSDGDRGLERVRDRAAYLFLYEERKASREQLARDTALRYPLSFTMKAEEVFADLQRADYAYYLSPDHPDSWGEFPVDYCTPNANRRTQPWVEWVCTTFSKNPIVAVTLGEVFRNQSGNPAVPYQLTLQDGQVLRGDIQFELLDVGQEIAQWTPRGGLNWHMPKTDAQ